MSTHHPIRSSIASALWAAIGVTADRVRTRAMTRAAGHLGMTLDELLGHAPDASTWGLGTELRHGHEPSTTPAAAEELGAAAREAGLPDDRVWLALIDLGCCEYRGPKPDPGAVVATADRYGIDAMALQASVDRVFETPLDRLIESFASVFRRTPRRSDYALVRGGR